MHTETTLDWNKPLCNRDGKPARLICTDVKHPDRTHMVLVDWGNKEYAYQVTESGEYLDYGTSYDIINTPEIRVAYQVIYTKYNSPEVSTLSFAKAMFTENKDFVCFLKITYTNGVISSTEVVE